MSHIHWVARQNKLETPKEKDEVNKREVHECDRRGSDPNAMVDTPTLKSTLKAKVLTRTTTTITSSCEENASLRNWPMPRLCYASRNPETKAKVSSPASKVPDLRANPNIDVYEACKFLNFSL